MINPDGMIGDNLKTLGHLRDDVSGKMFGMARQYSIDMLTFLDQFRAGENTVIVIEDNLIVPRGTCLNSIAQPSRYQKFRLLGHADAPGKFPDGCVIFYDSTKHLQANSINR